MDNTNNIYERKNFDGSKDYIVNMGNILYNNKIVSLSNVLIPIRQQNFFSLPDEKRFYAAVNVYYSVDIGQFVFDTVKKSDKSIDSCDSDAIANMIPIGQFILQQTLSIFEVKKINPYSRMSTFAISNDLVKGDRGLQGEVGDTGFKGYTGFQGSTGSQGPIGETGPQGETSIGFIGYTGLQGCTGLYPDKDLQAYYKFKTDDIYLTDYSMYERDLLWDASGAGITGVAYTGIDYNATGIVFIDHPQSSITLKPGIQDNSHEVHYNGGISSYSNSTFVGFTGTIHTWVNVRQTPIAEFIYETEFYTGMIGYPVRFIDASLYYPEHSVWDIEGSRYDTPVILHTFGFTGIYKVTLTVSNDVGSHSKTEFITIE